MFECLTRWLNVDIFIFGQAQPKKNNLEGSRIMTDLFQEEIGLVGPSHGRLGQAWSPPWLFYQLLGLTG